MNLRRATVTLLGTLALSLPFCVGATSISLRIGEVTHEPDVLVQVALSANRSEPNELTINGALARVRSFDEQPWVYVARIPLHAGINELDVRASFEDGESRTVQRQIRYEDQATSRAVPTLRETGTVQQ